MQLVTIPRKDSGCSWTKLKILKELMFVLLDMELQVEELSMWSGLILPILSNKMLQPISRVVRKNVETTLTVKSSEGKRLASARRTSKETLTSDALSNVKPTQTVPQRCPASLTDSAETHASTLKSAAARELNVRLKIIDQFATVLMTTLEMRWLNASTHYKEVKESVRQRL